MDFKLNKNSLNLRVYTATAIPEGGTGNEVVIISDVEMENWILSPDTPKGTPRNEGDVWLQYATNGGNLNILKTNTMLIIIMSVRQYIGGEWVEKEFEVLQNGSETDNFNGVLYYNGSKFDDLSFTTNSYMTVTEKTDHLYFYLSANTQGIGYTVKSYDLTPYNKLVIQYEEMSTSTSCGAAVYKSRSQIKATSSSNTEGTLTLDISTLTGEHELGFTLTANEGGKTAKVTYFALEK